jgi:hypothetical protein
LPRQIDIAHTRYSLFVCEKLMVGLAARMPTYLRQIPQPR